MNYLHANQSRFTLYIILPKNMPVKIPFGD